MKFWPPVLGRTAPHRASGLSHKKPSHGLLAVGIAILLEVQVVPLLEVVQETLLLNPFRGPCWVGENTLLIPSVLLTGQLVSQPVCRCRTQTALKANPHEILKFGILQ